MSGLKKTLGEYCEKQIVIPCYQRGYIWGKKNKEGTAPDAVSYMLKTLDDSYNNCKKQSSIVVFIQGITVVESSDRSQYIVIDGQQRSVFFYLLLKALGDDAFSIEYNSSYRKARNSERDSPEQWLQKINGDDTEWQESEDEYYQDIYFFKKTLRLIKEHNFYKCDDDDEKKKRIQFLKKKVQFLLVSVDGKIAVTTFKMMNGNKAQMEDFELIKADLLRRASIGTGGYKNKVASEWDNISLRSRYAHEWDKWLHWWNRQDVQLMYNCSNPMGWLLRTVFKGDDNLYEKYKECIDNQGGKSEAQKAKQKFSDLRLIQNHFEEAFSDPVRHNQFGLIVRLLNEKDVTEFIHSYFKNEETVWKDLKIVYNLLLFNMTYKEIIDTNIKAYEGKKETFCNSLLYEPIYGVNNELAYRYLLVRNVEHDNELKRKFDFTSWKGNRSLEHVYPKSMVVHQHEGHEGQWFNGSDVSVKDLEGLEYDYKNNIWKNHNNKSKEAVCKYMPREVIKSEKLLQKNITITEHSIGNLLLLYGKDNSAFGNKMPEEKRTYYFESGKEILLSRNLLHTIFSFGRFEHFRGAEICENHLDAINDIEKRIKKMDFYFHKKEEEQ